MAHRQSLVHVSILAKHGLRHNQTLEAADIFCKQLKILLVLWNILTICLCLYEHTLNCSVALKVSFWI